MRTLAALLTFFSVFVIAWVALVLTCAAAIHLIGIEDSEGAIGIGFALLIAPVIAYVAAAACGILVITPRAQSGPRV